MVVIEVTNYESTTIGPLVVTGAAEVKIFAAELDRNPVVIPTTDTAEAGTVTVSDGMGKSIDIASMRGILGRTPELSSSPSPPMASGASPASQCCWLSHGCVAQAGNTAGLAPQICTASVSSRSARSTDSERRANRRTVKRAANDRRQSESGNRTAINKEFRG